LPSPTKKGIFTGMKKGLVLEGGAMRGLFSAGVLDVMMENKIIFDGAIGVSAGAAFGCNYKSGQIGRTIRYNTKYAKDPRFCSYRSLIKTGDMFGADFCYREIPEKLDIFDVDAYNKNPMAFYVVASDIESGKAFYKDCSHYDEKTISYIRASASMPLAANIVEIEGRKFLDGGIADSIPLTFFESIGYDRNVLVLTQPKDYLKKKNSLLGAIKIRFRKYPKLVDAMADRHIRYNETLRMINEREQKGEIFVIRPDEKLPVGHVSHDPDQMREIYRIGRETGEKQIEKLKAFLNG